jgi:16S rRNA (guanine527-N7)-methyltransferase
MQSELNSFSEDINSAIKAYWDMVLEESKTQNLTSDLEWSVFLHKHMRDVVELENSQLLEFPSLDLGSGGGLPGLVHAIISPASHWVLTESEGRKADFLKRAVEALGLASRVTVYSGRAENYLARNQVGSVCVRAVGSIEKIFGSIRNCSTWNSLVLLKGPKWDDEYSEFKKRTISKELKEAGTHIYQLSTGDPNRIIIKLKKSN